MATDYSVTIINHSAHSDYFMIFQNDPGSFDPNAMALAWFSKYSNPGPNVTVKFTWTVDWGFSWADTGTLSPGIIFDASDKVPISTGKNKITLDYNGAYQFSNQQAGADPDHFYIAETVNIPINSSASVGITMSGSTVYATQARPSTNITATPHPQYYLAYGNYQEGKVIDISSADPGARHLFFCGARHLFWAVPGTYFSALIFLWCQALILGTYFGDWWRVEKRERCWEWTRILGVSSDCYQSFVRWRR